MERIKVKMFRQLDYERYNLYLIFFFINDSSYIEVILVKNLFMVVIKLDGIFNYRRQGFISFIYCWSFFNIGRN